MENQDIHNLVRQAYAKVAVGERRGCGCGGSRADASLVEAVGKRIGYDEQQLKTIPDEANLGLGCGNPTALGSLRAGEVVLDLGSGGGIDCFLASSAVGAEGRVIGVDMTPEMIDRARATAQSHSYSNVEFRLGEIENLPVADSLVDVVISNCVINLATDKGRVFHEAFRVLKPGGRLMVSDIVLVGTIPEEMRNSPEAYAACLGRPEVPGAVPKKEYLASIAEAGFQQVTVMSERSDAARPWSRDDSSCGQSEVAQKEFLQDISPMEKGSCCQANFGEVEGSCCQADFDKTERFATSLQVRAVKPES